MSDTAKTAAGKPLSLVWLRRDLRLYDQAIFAAATKAGNPIQPVFIFDSGVLARFARKNDRRLTFIAEALCRLHAQLQKKGGGILVFHGHAETIIPNLCNLLSCSHLFAAEDFEPATRKRDASVKQALNGKISFTLVLDHLLMHPEQIMKGDGTPYKVFTPYSKAWRERAKVSKDFTAEASLSGLECADMDASTSCLAGHALQQMDPSQGVDAMLNTIGYVPQKHDWPVDGARKHLHAFAESHIDAYKTERDFMANPGTSRLSPYLRFGLLSIRECARIAFEQGAHGLKGAETWLGELIWRDFYAMILYHFPFTATQEMQEQTRAVKWSDDEEQFQRFAEGKTGYPIIDAAMRQLLEIGWMHNRARMIVASFMSKDLLLDWRMGEEHFAQHLMDYELSSNVGGWQWAASTGTDAQPYFRVFNPTLQSEKFDPTGDYIRRFVPELARLSNKDIHAPDDNTRPENYPAPMVEHKVARDKAIAAFKKTRAA